jgi:osmotically-inducible protein OsmY
MITDAEIQKNVMDHLKWQPILNAAEIGVSVKNGIVTLSGIVDSYSKKIAAENAVKKLAGVRAVAEDIQVGVSPSTHRTDTEIAEASLHALRWNASVPDENIKLKVENGIVTLEGEVEWEYQRRAARSAIENLNGVSTIFNLIVVKSKVVPGNVKQKISSALHRSATLDADKIFVDVVGNKVVLTGKVRSLAEKEDAIDAAWTAPGVDSVESKIEIAEEELVF